MQCSGTNHARRALSGALFAVLAATQPVSAEDRPPASQSLRVMVSVSGRSVLDGLLQTIANRAGVSTQLAVRYAEPLRALREFCHNEAGLSPDVVLVSHRMQPALAAECARNGAQDVAAVELGRNALILAVRRGSDLTGLTSRQVYLAIAREVPYRDDFTRNTAVRWVDVDASLPVQDIRFQLPMRDEGSRATFDSLVLQGGCRHERVVKQVFDAQQRTARCITTRSDRVRELPRPQALKALLDAPIGTVGVLSQRELIQSGGELVPLKLDGIEPSVDAINHGMYEYSNSYWLYAKRGPIETERIIAEALDDAVIGPQGPLTGLGLIPLPTTEREAQRSALAKTDSYGYGLGAVLEWFTSSAIDAWHMFGVGASQPMPPHMAAALDFVSLMDIAGYQVTGIESSIGLIPDAGMTFGMAREMSDADHAYLERILYRDSLARPGALAAMQRRIIRSIMDVREVGGFEVTKVEIDFLPLPKVGLMVTPKGRTTGRPADAGDE